MKKKPLSTVNLYGDPKISVKISLIVPLYNSSTYIKNMIEIAQKIKYSSELLLINDGSTDDTAEICQKYADEYSFVRFIDKPHSGVSDTRNVGIRSARGKYLLFLDADDSLSDGSADTLYDFFETCGDAVDLITYPIETHYKGQILPPHFRYKTMTYSGIYDLNAFPYIGQTTMNIMVRNKFENNIYFDTAMNFSEDQKYCCDILREKMKMGFCNEAKYIYNRSELSSSGKLSGACYIFEQAMKMFEDMFRGYDTVPAAFQGLYINDLAWKLRTNILYPYNYDEKSFEFAMFRIKALLAKVDANVILEHPDIDFFHKFYWLSLKPNVSVTPFFHQDNLGLCIGREEIYKTEKIEIVVVRLRVDDNKFIFRGFLKSPVFSFSKKPKLFAKLNHVDVEQELFLSAHSYYLCRTQTNVFYGFCLETSFDELKTLGFSVKIAGKTYECSYSFMAKSPFSKILARYDTVIADRHVRLNIDTGEFSFDNKNWKRVLLDNTAYLYPDCASLRKQAIKLKSQQKIYLYYDCRGVEKDNGYYHFINDYGKNDGIVRKYICDPANKNLQKLFTSQQLQDVIPFGSKMHKMYFLAAEKIYTAYIEDINLIPFEIWEYSMYSDFFSFEVIYLQHGILHASLPWKYTPEVITADKICISTSYERRLFNEKYHFRKNDLIEEIMPRLMQLDKNSIPKKKILFAPSWRQYLIGPDIDGVWQPMPEVFLPSDYYKKINDFLNSEQLDMLLEKYGYVLEFKLHPIFATYHDLFEIKSKNVKIVKHTDRIEDYEIFITDFSSFVFDFLYLGRKVFSFIPDKMQFESGMNSYREIEPESERSFVKISGIEDIHKIFETTDEIDKIEFFS